jgi:SAM-dependent methyltransferase
MTIILGILLALILVNLGIFFGAPYLPILAPERDKLLDLVDLKPGQTILDLGCGDGTLLLAAARRGIRGVGYEISPFWWLVATLRTRRYRKLVTIQLANYWQRDWPKADAIYIFLITRFMTKATTEFARRLDYPVMVASYGFALPEVPVVRLEGAIYLYKYPLSLPN